MTWVARYKFTVNVAYGRRLCLGDFAAFLRVQAVRGGSASLKTHLLRLLSVHMALFPVGKVN